MRYREVCIASTAINGPFGRCSEVEDAWYRRRSDDLGARQDCDREDQVTRCLRVVYGRDNLTDSAYGSSEMQQVKRKCTEPLSQANTTANALLPRYGMV